MIVFEIRNKVLISIFHKQLDGIRWLVLSPMDTKRKKYCCFLVKIFSSHHPIIFVPELYFPSPIIKAY